jgi:hypothetical protein
MNLLRDPILRLRCSLRHHIGFADMSLAEAALSPYPSTAAPMRLQAHRRSQARNRAQARFLVRARLLVATSGRSLRFLHTFLRARRTGGIHPAGSRCAIEFA